MNFGFDMDDTLTAEPEVFSVLTKSLIACGHEVHVITGVGLEEWTKRPGRERILADLDIAYTEIHVAEYERTIPARRYGYWKRELCEFHHIRLMFEDRQDLTAEISPSTRCVLMVPRP